jgi:large subunit ribosomal protein L15
MKLNQIRDNAGARHAPKRLGRGIGSGLGKTSGRGGKGQTARTGVSLNGFEGGQTPIYRRLPKRGFNNIFARDLQELNLDRLQQAIDDGRLDAAKPITAQTLVEAGVIRRALDGVRLLGDGAKAFKAKISASVAGASATARAAIEKAGGSVSILPAIREAVVKDSAAKRARREKRKAKEAKPAPAPKAEAAEGAKPEKAAKTAKPAKPAG